MAVYQFDPLGDSRWEEFLQKNPCATVFHSLGWLDALRRTYGFSPIVYTTSPPGRELQNGIVFCRVASWLTGHRLVSVPFADHCEPLVDGAEDRAELLSTLEQERRREKFKFIELRPRHSGWLERGFGAAAEYYLHTLDVRRDLEQLFRAFHKDSVQRRIRHAEHAGVVTEEGNTEWHLKEFYRLFLLTRRRHQLPPQPTAWFSHLVTCLGERMKIRLALHRGRCVAGILTLSFKNTLVYKYGCSDAKYNHLGGTALLFWKMVRDAKEHQITEVDLGRSDRAQTSLITFKERWGAVRYELTYACYPVRSARRIQGGRSCHFIKRVFANVPDRVLTTAGRLLYRHIG